MTPPSGPNSLGIFAHHERRTFARLAGLNHFLVNGRKEAHHQLQRFGPQVLDQCQTGDQLVHRPTGPASGWFPLIRAEQLGQRYRAPGLLNHVEDPRGQRVIERVWRPTRASDGASRTVARASFK